MRLKFERTEKVGHGEEKEVFTHPSNSERVVSAYMEGRGPKSPEQLKGSFYLTKTLHLLAPENIPDIHDVGVSEDDVYSFSRDRIPHSEIHTRLQSTIEQGGDGSDLIDELEDEIPSSEKSKVEEKLGDLGQFIDSNYGNFLKDAEGNIQYLENFTPWYIDQKSKPPVPVLDFDADLLWEAIQNEPNEEVKKHCVTYFTRLKELFELEKTNLAEAFINEKVDAGPLLLQFTAEVEKYSPEQIAYLYSVTTPEEANENTPKRLELRDTLIRLKPIMDELTENSTLSQVDLEMVTKKFQELYWALGIRNASGVRHSN